MARLKFLILILIFEVMKTTMTADLLTYTVRFHKLKFHQNVTGNYTIDQFRDIQYVNGHINILSTKFLDKVIVIFHRCNLDGNNCEYFQTWTFTDLCFTLKQKNQIWSRWYGSFDPPMICPIDKVHYQIKNGTVDVDPFIRWYSEAVKYRWILTQKLITGDTLVGTYSVEATPFGYRKKPKKPSKN